MTEQNIKDTPNPGPASVSAGADAREPGGVAVAERPRAAAPGMAPASLAEGDGSAFHKTNHTLLSVNQVKSDVIRADHPVRPAAGVAVTQADGSSPQPGGPVPSGDPAPQAGDAAPHGTPGAWLAPGPDGEGPDGGFALEEWFATPQGAYVLNWELARIDQVVADIFGYYAVQVGLPGIDFLRANRMPNRLTASLRGSPGVVADAHELPFASESLDLVVLPHLLEFSSEPHQILREVERVLRPEGQVVILCFNPVSLWGVKKLFAAPPHAPWSGEFVSVLRMKDWLKLLNFEMRGGRFGCYRPPYTSEKWLGRFGFLEHAGDRWWPVAGAVYLMQAKKRVPGIRLITPSWRKERRKAEALAPSANGANRGQQRLPGTHAPQPVHTQVQKPKDPA